MKNKYVTRRFWTELRWRRLCRHTAIRSTTKHPLLLQLLRSPYQPLNTITLTSLHQFNWCEEASAIALNSVHCRSERSRKRLGSPPAFILQKCMQEHETVCKVKWWGANSFSFLILESSRMGKANGLRFTSVYAKSPRLSSTKLELWVHEFANHLHPLA